jgi:ATP-dependent Clp endopeptidase proteolytic subunit ClpP
MTVPKYIADAAAKGLQYRRDGRGGPGLADSTITAARRMASGTVSDEKIILANAWAARHAVDLDAPKNSRRSDPGFPGPGAVAHYLWGIDPVNPAPARAWFARQAEKLQAQPTAQMPTPSWFKISNAGTSAEISIYEEIGMGGVTPASFISQLTALGKIPITVRINSLGGSVFDGLAIYNLLRDHVGGVTIKIDGVAASMASVVAMAGTRVIMSESALMMIHNPNSEVAGEASDLRNMAQVLDQVKNSLVAAYHTKTKMSPNKIAAMMDAETWMSAPEALALGFIDAVEKSAVVVAKFDTKRMPTLPAKFQNLMSEPTNIPETPAPVAIPATTPTNATAEEVAALTTQVADMMTEIHNLIAERDDLVAQLALAKSTMPAEPATPATAEAVATAQAERDTLAAQFAALNESATAAAIAYTNASKQLESMTAQLATANAATVSAKANAVRLEALAGLRGVTAQGAAAPAPVAASASSPQHFIDTLNGLSGSARTEYFRANSAAIRSANRSIKLL